MSEYKGYALELFNAKGLRFKCSYFEISEVLEAARNLMEREPSYFALHITPTNEQNAPSTMEEWIAAGYTTD